MDINSAGKAASNLVQQMFKKDADKSGTLSAAEFKDWATSKPGNSTANTAALEASFKKMDSYGNGELTEAEANKFFTPPQVASAQLDSTTTSSLLSMLSQENANAASTNSADLLTKLLQNYTNAASGVGKFSTDA